MINMKSQLIQMSASMLKGRHIEELRLSESQKTVSCRKLRIIIEGIEDKQRLDAIFLRKVFDCIIELETKGDK